MATVNLGTLMRLRPPGRESYFTMAGYCVWDGSIIRDDTGRCHLYASRWPAELGYHGWLTHSRVIRAEADHPLGPYTFVEQIDALNAQPWARDMAHNARVHRLGDAYVMFYIGTTWGHDDPHIARRQCDGESRRQWTAIRFRQRIGVATAPSARGPWTPCPHNPVLHPRPGEWDHGMTTNPTVMVLPDGRTGMVYKSTAGRGAPLQLGLAVADTPVGPYARLQDTPLFADDVEDPFVWREAQMYRMLIKDDTGDICGIQYAGLLYESDDGRRWRRVSDRPAYDLRVSWRDGSPPDAARFVERPCLVVDHDARRYLLNAVWIDPGPSGVLVREVLAMPGLSTCSA